MGMRHLGPEVVEVVTWAERERLVDSVASKVKAAVQEAPAAWEVATAPSSRTRRPDNRSERRLGCHSR